MTAVNFEQRMKEERKYYLGYADKVPGTDKSVADARAEYHALLEKEQKKADERRQGVLDKLEPETFTTSVGNGEIVEVQRKAFSDAGSPSAAVTAEDEADNRMVLTKEDLGKYTKDQLSKIAFEEYAHVTADNATKEELIDVILSHQPGT